MAKTTHSPATQPPKSLKAKIGGAMPTLDQALIERAEASLQALSGQFDAWMAEEVGKLERALAAVESEGLGGDAGLALYRSAHDLKGLGATYEFPMVSRLGASLSKLIENGERRAKAPMALVRAHVAAIRAARRDQARGGAAVALADELAGELEQQVGALLGA